MTKSGVISDNVGLPDSHQLYDHPIDCLGFNWIRWKIFWSKVFDMEHVLACHPL